MDGDDEAGNDSFDSDFGDSTESDGDDDDQEEKKAARRIAKPKRCVAIEQTRIQQTKGRRRLVVVVLYSS